MLNAAIIEKNSREYAQKIIVSMDGGARDVPAGFEEVV